MINNIALLPHLNLLSKCLLLIVNGVLSVMTRHLCPVSEVLLKEHKSAIHYISHRMLCWQKQMARILAKQVKVHSCTSACPQRSCQCCASPEAPSLSTAPAMLVTRVPSSQASVSALAHQSFQHIFSWQINSSFSPVCI